MRSQGSLTHENVLTLTQVKLDLMHDEGRSGRKIAAPDRKKDKRV